MGPRQRVNCLLSHEISFLLWIFNFVWCNKCIAIAIPCMHGCFRLRDYWHKFEPKCIALKFPVIPIWNSTSNIGISSSHTGINLASETSKLLREKKNFLTSETCLLKHQYWFYFFHQIVKFISFIHWTELIKKLVWIYRKNFCTISASKVIRRYFQYSCVI